MFRLFFEFFLAIIFCYSIIILPLACEQVDKKKGGDKGVGCTSSYNPPGTVVFPIGDEELNTDILERPGVNEVHEKKGQDFQQFTGQCPGASPPGAPLQDTHTPCGGDSAIPPEILYSSDADAAPTVQCKKCDLKVTSDGKAVIVRCFECYDIPPPSNVKHRIEKELLYLVYFLEIANYTRPPIPKHELLPEP